MRPFPHFAKFASVAVLAAFAMAASEPRLAAQTSSVSQLPPEVLTYADTIFTNGKVLPVDRAFSVREAIAIRDGKVMATGTTAEIERMAGPNTRKIDLGGRTIIPGIIDTHLHPWNFAFFSLFKLTPDGGSHMQEAAAIEPRFRDFSNTATVTGNSIPEILQNLKAAATSRKPGTWIGGQVNSTTVAPALWDKIHRGDLDKAVPNNPLILSAAGGFLINTKALNAVKAFYGSYPIEFEKDQTGIPNGRIDVVMEELMVADLLFDHPMQSMYPAFREQAYRDAAYGITTDAGRLLGLWYEPVFREMDRRHELPIRIAYNAQAPVFAYGGDFFKRLGDITGMGTESDMIWMDGIGITQFDLSPCTTVKPKQFIFAECSLSMPDNVKYQSLYEGVKFGNKVANVHVTGDLTADRLMNLIESASKAGGMTPEQIRERGHGMDHCSLNPRPDQIERGKKLGIIWSCGGNFLDSNSGMVNVFGVEAVTQWSQPVASIIRAGGKVAGEGEGIGNLAKGDYEGTWHPGQGVTTDSYFSSIEMLLTRKDSQGHIWNANEAIDRKDALRMFTMGSADYVDRADRLGSLEPGKLADLVVLDKDYMAIPNDQFHTIHALLTMVGGKVVFQANGSWTPNR